MAKKYAKLWENASKTMPKRGPKSMINRWIFRTCDFLIFAKSITLKSFFHMIRGTRNRKKTIKNLCNFEVRVNHAKLTKWNPNWIRIQVKTLKKWSSKIWWILRKSRWEFFFPRISLKWIQINKITYRKTTKRKQPTPDNLQKVIQR